MTMNDLIEIALSDNLPDSYDVNLTLDIDGEPWQAYEANVAYRDILLLCDKGTLNYLVDTYGDKNTIELFEICKDE